jgi:hypothetical protein
MEPMSIPLTRGRSYFLVFIFSHTHKKRASIPEESPPRIPLTAGINWFLALIFPPYRYVGDSDIE